MKKNHWTQPYSSDYKQFGLKKFYTIHDSKLGDIRYCVIPGKSKHQKFPIILIQGMGLQIENWCLDFLKTLDDFTLYVIDPIKSFEIQDYAKSVYEVTKSISHFYFVGYSFGSFVIQEYMSLFPTEAVQKIVFIAGADICEFKLYNLQGTGMNRNNFDNQLILGQGISAIKARLSKKNCYLHQTEGSNIPILFVKADKEHIFKQDYLFRRNEEIIVENVNHNLLIQRPIYVAKKIKKFFNRDI